MRWASHEIILGIFAVMKCLSRQADRVTSKTLSDKCLYNQSAGVSQSSLSRYKQSRLSRPGMTLMKGWYLENKFSSKLWLTLTRHLRICQQKLSSWAEFIRDGGLSTSAGIVWEESFSSGWLLISYSYFTSDHFKYWLPLILKISMKGTENLV